MHCSNVLIYAFLLRFRNNRVIFTNIIRFEEAVNWVNIPLDKWHCFLPCIYIFTLYRYLTLHEIIYLCSKFGFVHVILLSKFAIFFP